MENYKKGAALSVAATVAGKVFSFISSLLLAFYFGATVKTDIYFYLILICAVITGWLSSINVSLVLPEFMHQREKSLNSAFNLANCFLYIYAAAALIFCTAAYFFPAQILGFISAFSPAETAQAGNLMFLSCVYFFSYFIMSYLISLSESFRLFGIYFLTPLNTLLPLLALLAFKNLEAMFLGYISAYWIQILFCLYILRRKTGWIFKPGRPELNRKFLLNFAYSQPSAFAWAAVLYAPIFMISSTQAGMVSAVNYSRMLSDSPTDILTSKVNNVAKVKFTCEAAKNQFEQMAQTIIKTDKFNMLLLVPFCVFTCMFAEDIIIMFFKRGGFTLQDAHNTAKFLAMFIMAVPFIGLNNNISNTFAALRIIKEITPRYLVLALVFTAFFIAGVKYYGAYAYPVLFLAMYAVMTLMNIITLRRFAPFIPYGRHIFWVIKMIAVSFLCAAAAKAIFAFYEGNVFIKIFINGSFFVAVNAAVLYWAGELSGFKKLMGAKWKFR